MAPSRGSSAIPSAAHSHHSTSDDIAVHQQSNSALINARRNFNYLVNPTTSPTTDRPTRLRTRALLRTLRYLTQFIFWRIIRYAKYAAYGAIAAAVSATAIGTFVSGVGWVLAPPSFGASIIAMSVWGTGKFVARRLHRRWQTTGKDAGEERRERVADLSGEEEVVRQAGRGLGSDTGPEAVPW
ncbi:hypothetical protein LTR64_003305 [Lithohypha guttulata]|uniref:uncharacterized protein n=1 Tax=Lithohypha guttulata TaxID=1690604 RepID=UPI002DE0DB63|nr:hypothetical protein LTR51_000475 [Lithohypha guttulata]